MADIAIEHGPLKSLIYLLTWWFSIVIWAFQRVNQVNPRIFPCFSSPIPLGRSVVPSFRAARVPASRARGCLRPPPRGWPSPAPGAEGLGKNATMEIGKYHNYNWRILLTIFLVSTNMFYYGNWRIRYLLWKRWTYYEDNIVSIVTLDSNIGWIIPILVY